MALIKKIIRDKNYRALGKEYDGLRADFNNGNMDYKSFEKEANELLGKFSNIQGVYSNSINKEINGYIFNIQDFIIRNRRLYQEEKDQKTSSKKKNKKSKASGSSSYVFSNHNKNLDLEINEDEQN